MSEAGNGELQTRIKKWLKESGFPLEMKAAQVFRNEGYEVRQSHVVKDLQENKPRELDILANFPFELDRGITKISCIAECKSSQNPWLVFTADDTLTGQNKLLTFAVSSPDARVAITQITSSDKSRESWRIFDDTTKCGYAVRQSFASNDTAYAAAMNLLKACRNVIEPGPRGRLPQINVAFPILVVDTPIFECSYVENEIRISEVPHSSFLFSSYIPDMTMCLIRIVHIDHLDIFARHYAKKSTAVREILADYERLSIVSPRP